MLYSRFNGWRRREIHTREFGKASPSAEDLLVVEDGNPHWSLVLRVYHYFFLTGWARLFRAIIEQKGATGERKSEWEDE